MQFDAMNKIKNPMSVITGAKDSLANVDLATLTEVTGTVAKLALEQSRKLLAEINLLLQLLQSAGYGVASLDVELNLPPKVTIKLQTGPAVKEEKLTEIVRDHADQKVVTTVVASLIQANKLRGSVTVDSLAMAGIEIVLTTTPNITLQWKDKDKDKEKTAA
jgi:hypothetical protein